MSSSILHVQAGLRPSVRGFDFYSAYYRESLKQYLPAINGSYEEQGGRLLPVVRKVRRVRDAYRLERLYKRTPILGRALDRLAVKIEGVSDQELRYEGHHFVFRRDGRELRVVLDSLDHRDCSADSLAWSDVYLKTNYWPTMTYPAKVHCLPNADPLVLAQLPTMRAGRTKAKEYDICMVVRVWGGRDEVEGVEHNLRLIEAVNRAPGKKFLYAFLVAGDIEASRKRLEAQGIPCGTDPLLGAKLWQATAASRLNIIRLGMHYCIPWRFTGALAIGSAIVLDRKPFTLWPKPLEEGSNYLSLGVENSVEEPLAPDAQYEDIPRRLREWLADESLAKRIAANNATYYDEVVAPKPMGQQMVETVARFF